MTNKKSLINKIGKGALIALTAWTLNSCNHGYENKFEVRESPLTSKTYFFNKDINECCDYGEFSDEENLMIKKHKAGVFGVNNSKEPASWENIKDYMEATGKELNECEDSLNYSIGW